MSEIKVVEILPDSSPNGWIVNAMRGEEKVHAQGLGMGKDNVAEFMVKMIPLNMWAEGWYDAESDLPEAPLRWRALLAFILLGLLVSGMLLGIDVLLSDSWLK